MSTVLVSPADSIQELVRTLESAGARCITWPGLLIEPPDDASPLREAIENLFGYDWVVLKNLRAANYFLQALRQQRTPDALDTLRVVAVGQITSEKGAEFQIHVDIALERFATAEVFSLQTGILTEVAEPSIVLDSSRMPFSQRAVAFLQTR